MKYRRSVALLLVTILLMLCLPVSVFAEDSDMRYGRKKLGEMANGAALQFAYDKLVDGCTANTPITIDLSHLFHTISVHEFNDYVFPMFYGDYPEYFWIPNSDYNYRYDSSMKILDVTFNYNRDFPDLASAKSAYNTRVNQLTAGISGSDYDKAKTLHDRLIGAVTYISSDYDQSAYGALVEGRAVCNGYARAYQHLLQKVGIPAWHVWGVGLEYSTNTLQDHAWNLVKLDGQWYYTDVTWDDQGSNTFYSYFNITAQQLQEDHIIDSSLIPLLPQATATAANFYVREDSVFSDYDRTNLVRLLKKGGNTTQIYITGNSHTFLTALNNDMLEIGKALGGKGGFTISHRIAQLGRGIILSVNLITGDQAEQPSSTPPATTPATTPATKPTTKPTVAPTTAPTTVPTTAPTTAPVTIPATVPTTAPTTAPVTIPATVPTTTPATTSATIPATAPTTKPTATAPTVPSTTAATAAPVGTAPSIATTDPASPETTDSPEVTAPNTATTDLSSAPSPSEPSSPQGAQDDRDSGKWMLPVCVIILAAGATGIILRKKQNRSAENE